MNLHHKDINLGSKGRKVREEEEEEYPVGGALGCQIGFVGVTQTRPSNGLANPADADSTPVRQGKHKAAGAG
ncbi:hypothetical protein QN360_05880 [Glaciimonas sp. CA11.2]|uniref:hypothetical protein n=1 Tax=Glaciimonas sp. CA11.2 TaxID=3048601 RepID=UPI002AB4A976|nr:hypothetical protein [Glaciimonas sp. CA11.2]MDY7545290.1 hypothetical protein [Glaciimonas sp. CA11.2]MEB0162434.1 hypothetical protein [Glaciimonas sp. CA11.2]